LFIALTGALSIASGSSAWAGKDKHDERERHYQGHDDHGDRKHEGRHFSEHERVVVRDYYEDQLRRGQCPPGLAKKRNGCLPPGHAKRWHAGERLPRGVVYYDVPPAVVVQLPPPRAGYRYVRIANDILLIAAGTGLVVDAIGDLGRM